MRDDTKNAETRRDDALHAGEHEALKFYFTPVDEPRPGQATENPHAKSTTFVPEVVEALKEHLTEAVERVELYAGEHTVFVERERIVDAVRFLKEEQGFTYLVDLGGIDRFEEGERYEVAYNLVNLKGGHRLRLKVRVPEDDLTVPTLTGLFRAAGWNEREVWDMFGIRFDGHPDMRRMFMPEDFEYHPLRKEFPLLGIPGSLPLPPNSPEGELNYDPFPVAHGNKPVKSYEEPASSAYDDKHGGDGVT